MILNLTAVIIPVSTIAQAQVSGALEAGEIARLLRIGGLEVATPLAMGDRLGSCGLSPGDRVAVFSSVARPGDFPSPVRTGGREVTVLLNHRKESTNGRPALTIGVPDPSEPPAPDIDLREIARSSRINLLPAQCAALLFDGQAGQWFAALTGGARVLIDDYELTQQPIPISAMHTLRFYTPLDDPSAQPALAELIVTVSSPVAADAARLPAGSLTFAVRFGTEMGPFSLRASDNVRVGQLAAGLVKQADLELQEGAQVARLRLAPPTVRVGDLLAGELLYAKS